MRGVIAQIFPPSPTLTEKNAPSLAGKVFIVTGGNAGVGLELVKILHAKGGTVYIAGRSSTRIAAEIEAIKSTHTESPGLLKSLPLDLADLSTVSTCVSAFLAQESRLDVLWNNAGISHAPVSTTAQGHEIIMGTNCLGPFLLTRLLLPILKHTASISPEAAVRVVFASSGIIDLSGPPAGLSLDGLEPGNFPKDDTYKYSASKAGNWFLASEFDRRLRQDGVLCIAQSPGTLKTKGWAEAPWALTAMMAPFMHEPKMGAYTELWAGLSRDVKLQDGGRLAINWGRWHPSPKKALIESIQTKEEGGSGLAGDFWEWCKKNTEKYEAAG